MDGIINVLKPPGMTSHDVVGWVRRLLGVRKVGHTGTLDPGAAGVLPVCVGRATRLAEYLTESPKTYRAEILLGLSTTTQDLYGEKISHRPVPELTCGQMEVVLDRFRGEIEQIPPMVSAVKVQGRKLYEMARRGQVVDRPSRQVIIYTLTLRQLCLDGELPNLAVDITCSKGTYIRTIAADLGELLGCGACLAFLLRTNVGNFHLKEALTLEEIAEAHTRKQPFMVAPEKALEHLPAVKLDQIATRAFAHGRLVPYESLATPTDSGQILRVLDCGSSLIGIGKLAWDGSQAMVKPHKVMTTGEET